MVRSRWKSDDNRGKATVRSSDNTNISEARGKAGCPLGAFVSGVRLGGARPAILDILSIAQKEKWMKIHVSTRF